MECAVFMPVVYVYYRKCSCKTMHKAAKKSSRTDLPAHSVGSVIVKCQPASVSDDLDHLALLCCVPLSLVI